MTSRKTRVARWRRNIARTVLAVAVLVLFVAQVQLGTAHRDEEPGLMRTAYIALAVMVVALPFCFSRGQVFGDEDPPRKDDDPA